MLYKCTHVESKGMSSALPPSLSFPPLPSFPFPPFPHLCAMLNIDWTPLNVINDQKYMVSVQQTFRLSTLKIKG